jgi:hypothetical protein
MSSEKDAKSSETHPYPAYALSEETGAIFYDFNCKFIYTSSSPFARLSATGIGNVVGFGSAELFGGFDDNPYLHIGVVHFSLESAAFEGGGAVLTIRDAENKKTIGTFAGETEGFIESTLKDKKGHLHKPTTGHENLFRIQANPPIKVLAYHGEEAVIAVGQPYDGVDSYYPLKDYRNWLVIDVKAGRNETEGQNAAAFFNNGIGNDPANFISHMNDDNGSHLPTRLNFSIRGILTIDGVEHEIFLGQMHETSKTQNQWLFGSKELKSAGYNNGIFAGLTVQMNDVNSISMVKW